MYCVCTPFCTADWIACSATLSTSQLLVICVLVYIKSNLVYHQTEEKRDCSFYWDKKQTFEISIPYQTFIGENTMHWVFKPKYFQCYIEYEYLSKSDSCLACNCNLKISLYNFLPCAKNKSVFQSDLMYYWFLLFNFQMDQNNSFLSITLKTQTNSKWNYFGGVLYIVYILLVFTSNGLCLQPITAYSNKTDYTAYFCILILHLKT